MPRCGPTVDENSPLLGGASPRGAGVGFALLGKPTPSAFATAAAAAATPPREGISKGGSMFRWQMTSMLKFVVCFAAASAAGAFPGTAAKADLAKPQFESDVAPILRQHCVKCHGEGTPQAGLDLRSASSVLRGGKSGLVVVRGAPEKSYLFQRVSARTMPPPGSEPPLNDTEIQTLRKWIESGEFVAEPATEAAADTATRQISEQDRQFWSFRKPSSAPVPKLKGNHRVRTPIDSFVLAKLEAKGLTFAPDASKVALLRRAYFDLLGLPPTPEERDAFLSDNRSDAYEQLVDRLLASPAYGERWARHWLDVAGYTEAAHNDTDLPLYKEYYVYDGIWRYRDYVVSSFNQDKPYDQFLSEQIAGDELVDWRSASKYTPEILNDLIATGFLRGILDITSFSPAPQLPLEYNNVLTRVVDNFSSGILGLTAGCARCHDHKYDPITQNDYYRMQSIFASAYNPQDWKLQKDRYLPDVSKTEQEEIDKHNAEIDRPLNEITKQLTDLRRPHQQRIFEAKLTTVPELLRADVRAATETPADKRDPVQKYLFKKYEVALKVTDDELTKALSEKEQASAKKLEEQIAVLKGWRRSFGKIQALWDVGKPPTLHLLRRGNIETPGKEVEPGFFAVLCSPNKSDAVRPKDTQGNTSGRRLALARWVTSRDNPLTARVFVNQIWQHHFGKGIVSTPENFGRKGAPPTHPELLDWLAVDFMEHGWKIKRLHKLMMTSTTYRQSSELKSTAGIGVDPANDLLGRMNLRRLEAEAIRDNVLAVSGDLDRTFGGPPVLLDWTPDGLLTVSDKGPTPTSKWRRSLYMLARRNYLLSFLEVFDFPSLALNCTKRSNSATPLQSLTFLNSEFVMEQAEHFANRVNQLVGDSAPAEKKIEQAFVLALARRPSPTEIKACGDHLTKETQVYLDLKSSKEIASRQALTNICQTLLSTNEFLYLE
jgi:uncharacterized protein DUF1553/uncharacterized protein DUF1549/cytochrome c